MSVVVFEQNQSFVINSFKSGNFDYVDITTEIQEREFFQFLLDKEIIQHLGEIYPTPRKKEEVPAWPMFDIKDLFIEHKHLGFVTTFANLPYYFLYMNLPVMVEDIYYLIPPH